MGPDVALGLATLSVEDLAALRLSAQVMAHRAALAGLPRVELFFERLEAEADAEAAARGQRGTRTAGGSNPWHAAGLTDADRTAIREHIGLLAGNARLPPPVRDYARRLMAAGDLW
jgi:hypothetical protein